MTARLRPLAAGLFLILCFAANCEAQEAANVILGDGAAHLNFAGMGFSDKTMKLTSDSVATFLDNVRAGRCTLLVAEAALQLQSK
jgi:hypothetical protein